MVVREWQHPEGQFRGHLSKSLFGSCGLAAAADHVTITRDGAAWGARSNIRSGADADRVGRHSQGNPRLYQLVEHAPKTGKSPTVWAWPS